MCDEPDEKFEAWWRSLDEDVIQGEFGYEPGEFTVFPAMWRSLYDKGLTPRQAWRRALDEFAAGRIRRECDESILAARIRFEDAAIRDHS